VAVVSERLQKIPAKDMIFRDLALEVNSSTCWLKVVPTEMERAGSHGSRNHPRAFAGFPAERLFSHPRELASEVGINREMVRWRARENWPFRSLALRREWIENQPFRSPGNKQGTHSQN
jgi:hypothetical protein